MNMGNQERIRPLPHLTLAFKAFQTRLPCKKKGSSAILCYVFIGGVG